MARLRNLSCKLWTEIPENNLTIKNNIDDILPLAYQWAKEHELFILKNGIKLNVDQEIDAFLAGVKDPKKVRLLKTEQIPFPESPLLKKALQEIGLVSENTAGITLGSGIYINSAHWNKRELLVHELAHVMQYDRLGFKEFISQYITECFSQGYAFGPLEMEARQIEKKICS